MFCKISLGVPRAEKSAISFLSGAPMIACTINARFSQGWVQNMRSLERELGVEIAKFIPQFCIKRKAHSVYKDRE